MTNPERGGGRIQQDRRVLTVVERGAKVHHGSSALVGFMLFKVQAALVSLFPTDITKVRFPDSDIPISSHNQASRQGSALLSRPFAKLGHLEPSLRF